MKKEPSSQGIPLALYALMAGAFGIGTTEFVIMGLLPEVSRDLHVSIPMAGLLISGYALGVAVGAPIMSILMAKFSRKSSLLWLMAIFTLGNLICAVAPDYTTLMIARVVTSFAHGTFFGIGAVVATSLVPKDKRALAIALMFTGLTVANVIGVPAGTWLGQMLGWRSTFWAVTMIGPIALAALYWLVPSDHHAEKVNVRAEISTLLQPQVIAGLLLTIIVDTGLFAVLTYVAPILTDVAHFSPAAISPVFLLFGVGMVIGNIIGAKLADIHLDKTLIGALMFIIAILVSFSFFAHQQIAVVALVGLLGIAGFAAVPSLQIKILEKANGAPTLASAMNIGAFNIGNAAGAWVGGLVITHGLGLTAIGWIAGCIVCVGLALAIIEMQLLSNNANSTLASVDN
ncbi:MFS transporter [Methylophilus sp. UBA6697]|uniref:MFS transporter n=1 Tax=Methylophilus sp. UBA6697 TaxID=1946902 RepID=UPI000EDEEE12|nr:MFS transporter [Methylophilus sp. UBA6697]HCU85650.1 MFS transporter [Methylophilus sp.]